MLLTKSQNIADSELDGEICIFDSNSGEYFNLNKSASFIWKLLDKYHSEEQIISYVLDSFESDSADIRKEVIDFLKNGKKLGLITCTSEK